MNKTPATFAYTDTADRPVLTQTFEFDHREAEVVSLRQQIEQEGFALIEAGVHAVAALPSPDPLFVEWLTSGAFSLDATGSLTSDPLTMRWLAKVRDTGRAW